MSIDWLINSTSLLKNADEFRNELNQVSESQINLFNWFVQNHWFIH